MALDVDYVVVGKGMCGSAAAAHLAREGAVVVLVGPNEPENYKTHTGVFSSHYDEARITRIIDPVPNRAFLAKESIRRHRALEKETGISFFHEVGHLAVGEARGESRDYINQLKETAKHHRVEISVLFSEDLSKRFPYLQFGSRVIGVFQEKDAGYINPRQFIKANCQIVTANDGMLINEEANNLEIRNDLVRIPLQEKDSVFAKGAIVATGGFTNLVSLLPDKLDLSLQAELNILATISEETANSLANFPSLIYKPAEIKDHIYLLPPVKYPDGNWKIKLGFYLAPEIESSEETLTNWFQSAGPIERQQALQKQITELLPDVGFSNFEFMTCITTHTPNSMPVIKFYNNKKVVSLVGGNGFGAKCSDELGKIAASCLRVRRWNYPLPQKLFSPSSD